MTAQMQMPFDVSYSGVDVSLLSQEERHAILALAEKVALYGAAQREALTSPTLAKQFIAAQLRQCEREVFLVVFVDAQHSVIASESMFQGTLSACAVYPREVARRALELNAHAIFLGHPHPSGNPEISSSDRQITTRINECLELFDIKVLDHIVVGVGTGLCTSFAERGYL